MHHAILVKRRARFRDAYLPPSADVLPRKRHRIRSNYRRRSLGDDAATVGAGAWTHVDHVVRRVNCLLVMLDDDDGVTHVPQTEQRIQEPAIVALVQTDGRLVEHVHHTHESGADLAGKTDALRFTAGKRGGGSIQSEIIEAHVDKKLKSLVDLSQNPRGDLAAISRQLEPSEKIPGLTHRLRRDRGQGMIAHEDVSRVFVQACATASLAGFATQVLGKLLAHDAGFGLLVAPFHIRDDALEGMLPLVVVAPVAQIGEPDVILTASVENDLSHTLGQILERRIEIEFVVIGQPLNELEVISVAAVPATDGAARQTQLGMVNDPGGIEEGAHAQTVAGPTGAGRIVE